MRAPSRALPRRAHPAPDAQAGPLTVAGTAALVVAACVVRYAFPPERSALYPQCPFHAMTGLHCPGCGTLRALHALVHGDLRAALGHNLLTMLSLPFLAYDFLSRARQALWGRPLPWPITSAVWVWLLLAVILAFWLLRNLPFWPFSCLAP